MIMNKASLRNFLGNLPLAAELDWSLRQKNRARKDHYNLERLQKALPAAALQAIPYAQAAPAGKKDPVFCHPALLDRAIRLHVAFAGGPGT